MTYRWRYQTPGLVAVWFVALMLTPTAPADEILIDLEWRSAAQTVPVGTTVEVGLYAVARQDEQIFRALDMVFAWDQTYLQFLGVTNTGAADLLFSGLPSGDPFNLNEVVPPADGTGYYQAWARLGAPLQATSEGLLLTTFVFSALTPTSGTFVDIPLSGGSPVLETTVWGGPGANTNVTGTLGNALVEIVPEPSSLSLLFLGFLTILQRHRHAAGPSSHD